MRNARGDCKLCKAAYSVEKRGVEGAPKSPTRKEREANWMLHNSPALIAQDAEMYTLERRLKMAKHYVKTYPWRPPDPDSDMDSELVELLKTL